jgi:hypothetical protein
MFTGAAGKKEYNEYVNKLCENIHKVEFGQVIQIHKTKGG